MNYLGHALLSMGDTELLVGNMIGDYVKGMKAVAEYPVGIQRGIMLHRKIDSFTDIAPSSLRAQVWFRPAYGLYASPIIDTLFDHYLATDPYYFSSEKVLLSFTQDVYKILDENKSYFPEKFARMFPYMREQNWLYNYRTMAGARRSLQGLHRRAQYMPETGEAYNTFVTHYYELGQCYYEFIEKAYRFVNDELNGNKA